MNLRNGFHTALLALATASCGDGLGQDWRLGEASEPIINGEPPSNAYHEAVVGLLIEYGAQAYLCSGTLIASDVVLTAAHCVEGAPTAVWATLDDTVSWSGNLLAVSEHLVHEGYSGSQLVNDLALLRLAAPIADVDPVPYLPAALALTTGDAGGWVNFAGYGQDETGNSGTLLQADWTLGNVTNPCAYYARRGKNVLAGLTNCLTSPGTQAWYSQSKPNGSGGLTEIGPCFGDSGGPMFVDRDGAVYVGGVTSYGDTNCKLYGVSTRPDAFACWIDEFVQGRTDLCPEPPPECTVSSECDDTDSCTDDTCVSGSCEHVDNGSCGGGCSLGEPGDSCSSDSECCSGRCKGSPGNKTCR